MLRSTDANALICDACGFPELVEVKPEGKWSPPRRMWMFVPTDEQRMLGGIDDYHACSEDCRRQIVAAKQLNERIKRVAERTQR